MKCSIIVGNISNIIVYPDNTYKACCTCTANSPAPCIITVCISCIGGDGYNIFLITSVCNVKTNLYLCKLRVYV